MSEKSSRLPGFYDLSLADRMAVIAEWAGLDDEEQEILADRGLKASQANMMIENVLGTYELPLGIACNFLINGRDYLVPMTVEEPSVLAAVSNSAKLIRAGGGFQTWASDPVMIGQIQVLDVPDMAAAISAVEENKQQLMELADRCDPVIFNFGGGARDIQARPVNTALEQMAPLIAEMTGGRTSLRILSNLADQRTATAQCTIPAEAFGNHDVSGPSVARLIEEANAFAIVDPYRAATHNKGIMNGIDAVCIATGNDWRAIEAGAHSYAARSGQYTALTDWHVDENGDLFGKITLPMAVGIVGGATKVHPTARVALKILAVSKASELAQVMAAVGLAQNLAAIRALATVGIQQGHMRLHARQIAMAAGASEDQAAIIANQLVDEGNVRLDRAQEILSEA
jgi:hydroxymethylglutaryl-CoA reductase